MTHGEARELISGDPELTSAELLEHLKTCPECQTYRDQMLAFNAKIRRALELDLQKLQQSTPPSGASAAATTATATGAPQPRATPGATTPRATQPTSVQPAAPSVPAHPGPPPRAATPPAAAQSPIAGTTGSAAGQTTPERPGATRRATPPSAMTGAPGTTAGQTAPPQPAAAKPAARQQTPADSNVRVFPRKARPPVAKHTRPRLFAFAASLAAALIVGLTLWLSRPPSSLAAEVVTHVEGEPNSWHKTVQVPSERLEAVLRKSGVALGAGMGPVVYANSCWFRGHFVPHFVVVTQHGPVTVMILLHEQVSAEQRFSEDGYTGLLVPARTGSVAVISNTPMALEQPAGDVVRALQSAN